MQRYRAELGSPEEGVGGGGRGGAPGKRTLTGALPPRLAARAAAQLGQDFADVSIHEDGAAERLGTQAFAQGTALHFAAGAYRPDTADGAQMIGHELAHVAQQRSGRVAADGARGGVAVNTDPALEQEADAAGHAVVQGFDLDEFSAFGVTRSSGPGAGVVQGFDLGGEATPAAGAPAASPVPPEVLARVGAAFAHATTGYRYDISAGGGFILRASPDGKGLGLEFRHDNQYAKAWRVLADYVVAEAAKGTIPPTVAPPAAAPAEGEAPAADGDDSWGFDDLLGAVGDAATAVGDAVVGVVEAGLDLLASGLQIIEDAIASAVGATPDGEPSPDAPTTDAPTAGPGAPAGEPDAPSAAPAEPTLADMPEMSQFIWYGTQFQDLGVDEVYTVAKVLADELQVGSGVEKVTTPAAAVKKKNPNHGYWWFNADGKAAWDGNTGGGTQYVYDPIGATATGARVNPVAAYLAEHAPGQRPAEITFGDTPTPVSTTVQNLPLRNVPGPYSCFATSAAMMAQAGVHAVGSGSDAGITGIVTSETFRPWTAAELADADNQTDGAFDEAKARKRVKRQLAAVTIDAAAAAKAKAYIDFETTNGRPVFVGITYKDSDVNSDKVTDHWVVVSGKAGDGQYTFNDPGTSSTDAVDASANVFVWDGEKLHKEIGTYLYVVSWVRPNQESLAAWNAHWAELQGGASGAPTPAGE
ncbi:MAG: DUF4157 domain-containing protein [Kofleriaceae bacterium]